MPTNPTQRLLWVALPNGVAGEGDDRRLRLSVALALRLRADAPATLAQFPDFLDWAARMQPDRLRFTVAVDDGSEVEATIVSPPPDPALWRAAFGPATSVEAHRFDDYADRPLVTYPVGGLLRYLKDRYPAVAARSPEELPADAYLAGGEPEGDAGLGELVGAFKHGRFEGLRGEADLAARLAETIERAKDQARERAARHVGRPIAGADGAPIIAGDGATPAGAFEQAMLFHYRPTAAQPVDLPTTEEEARRQFETAVDFHQLLSALADYPALLRMLGLAFDLELPLDALPATPSEAAIRKVRVVPTWPSDFPAAATVQVSPWTRYWRIDVNGQALFMPVSATGEISAGFWTPPAAALDLVQVDADGAALKTLNAALSLAALSTGAQDRAIDAPEQSGLPALRTGGVSIVRSGQAAALNDGFNRAHNLNLLLDADPPQAADLHAEDLVRGYRVDVLDGQAGEWRSLHQRRGRYAFLDLPGEPLVVADEGMVQLGVTEPARAVGSPPDPNGELYIHEALVAWDGWSLAAPRPGKSLSRSPRAPTPDDPESQPQRVANTAMTTLRLETSFQVEPGSLPRLRFGAGYRLRVRAVDLAGNSLTLAEADHLLKAIPNLRATLPAQGELRYGRFEPVAAPVLAPRAEYGEGESLERLVIRSNYDCTAEEYAAAHHAYQPFCDRHVAPPKAALQLVETHGMLDAAFDARRDGLPADEARAVVQAAYQLALREQGSLDDPLPTTRFVATGEGDAGPQGYTVHAEEQLALPYLPDPLAIGVVFRGLPGAPAGEGTEVRYGGASWDQAAPLRLRVVEGDGPPAWDEAARVLTVSLPKAMIARVRLGSRFEGDLRQMGLWQWLEEAARDGRITPDALAGLEAAALEGRCWLFTPSRELTLVHAVQQPLAAPEALELTAERGWGDGFAHLRGVLALHAPSTAKLDLRAAWTEERDDPGQPAPTTISAQAHVFELPIALDGQPLAFDVPEYGRALRLEHDKHLLFDTALGEHLLAYLRSRLAGAASAQERTRLQGQIDLVAKLAPHQFGDTRYRKVRYQFSATSRFREYFAPPPAGGAPVEEPGAFERTSEPVVLEIPSAARPAAPRVLYVLPTFGWETSGGSDGATTSVRRGGGLRVYLDRPWYSSGDGELLGVVVAGSIASPGSAEYPYATYWGQDPLWQSSPPPALTVEDFASKVAVGAKLTLPELPRRQGSPRPVVAVAGHAVQFDPDRRLWCCDLTLGAAVPYFPFLRLALARYQPNSLEGLELSPVVLADFVPVAPDRSLTVARDPAQPGRYAVAVSGPAYRGRRGLDGAIVPGASTIEVSVQRRDPAVDDETLAWQPLTEPEQAVSLAAELSGDAAVWRGQVDVPPDAQGGRLRLVVKEYEPFAAAAVGPGGARAAQRRLVYVDTVAL